MMKSVPFTKLSNGVKMPLIGLGTSLSKGQDLENAVRIALDNGYRLFDTAEFYKNEEAVGNAIDEYIKKGKVKREDIFIITKLPVYGQREPERFIEGSLNKLKVDYIDLYLIHNPMAFMKADDKDAIKVDDKGTWLPDLSVDFKETWKVLEDFYNKGKLKSIGISNFNKDQIKELWDSATVKPQNLQVECHIYLPQDDLVDYCKSLGISLTSYGSLGSPKRPGMANRGIPLLHPLVKELAEKYNKTPAQILLKQLIQRGISVIPKSSNEARIKENIDISDFELSQDEMERFNYIKERKRLFKFLETVHHPLFPWKDELESLVQQDVL